MNKLGVTATVLLASTSLAQAGGIERTATTTGILFEEGTYLELSYGSVSPDVSGSVNGAPINSGDMAPSYNTVTLGFHHDINDQLSFSLIIDEPIGADVQYPGSLAPGGYPFAGSYAELSSRQITAALRYEMANNVSVYGGLRAVQVDGDVYVSTPLFTYELHADTSYELGYMLGAAYERPDIALRAALTYFSEVDLDISGVEGIGPAGTPAGFVPTAPTAFGNTLPESVLLELQSGIAEDTLLFGSVRWTAWDGYAITPNAYPTPSGNLVDYDDDVWTYTLGIGHRLNENWSISASLGYEAANGPFQGNLGPTDGFTSVGLGAEYTYENISVGAGVRYIDIGDAATQLGGGATSAFRDNDAIAVGLRVGFQF